MRRWIFLSLMTGALAVGLLVALPHLRQPDQRGLVARLADAKPLSTTDPRARFAILSEEHTNQCGLQASSIQALARGGRLQGACCGPMAFAEYEGQLEGLKRFAALAEVPDDPYDIAVEQAKRLIAYRDAIDLRAREQAVYEQAFRLAKEHGPCCCHCWRWDAFEGQAKYLITHRSFTSSQLATLWDLEDGCGGDA